ncbi:MAG: hypothetical protein A2X12_05260 [Bacteroidetes bacterium GWE2_29_8]|nr:MAG: hypothetical protein A2X12_05260 [Bacteroidetes bacterium GWE2_29_8]
MKKIIIFGMGDFARFVHYYFTEVANETVVGFTVDKDCLKTDSFLGLPVIPFEDINTMFPPDNYKIFIALAYKELNRNREKKYKEAKLKGYKFASFIHPTAIIAKNAKLGDNLLILENNIIQPFVKVGNNVIMWGSDFIGHDSIIEDNCFLSINVIIGGYVKISANSFLGLNSTIKNTVNVGKFNIIGASAVILKDTNDYAVYKSKNTEMLDLPSNEVENRLI